MLRCLKSAPVSQRLVYETCSSRARELPESCLRHCILGVSEVIVDSIDSRSLSAGFMRDKMHFLHIDIDTSTLLAPTLPWF